MNHVFIDTSKSPLIILYVYVYVIYITYSFVLNLNVWAHVWQIATGNAYAGGIM